MTDKIIVLSAASSQSEAFLIARALVNQRLAACVNIVSAVESVYRWEGKVKEAAEFLLMVKTTEAHYQSVRDALKSLHSYAMPECICIKIEDGDAAYLQWIGESVGQPSA